MKILIISGSRADAGPLITVKEELVGAGQEITWVDLPFRGVDTNESVVNCGSSAAVRIAATLAKDPTDLVLLLGDRYEILNVAIASFLMGKPIAHLSGGDITEGSQDDSMRHAISKLSHIHFTTCNESACRLLQMGEEPWRVHNVGCPGVDTLLKTQLLSIKHTLGAAGLPLGNKVLEGEYDNFILVAFHPNTLGDTAAELHELMGAVMTLYYRGLNVAFTAPNQDVGRSLIDQAFAKFVVSNPERSVYLRQPSRTLFLSLMKHCTTFIGNSSSGFYEAPYFGTHVVNIGDRQKGRQPSPNITNCIAKSGHIYIAAHTAYTASRITKQKYAPYGRGDAGKMIADRLSKLKITPALLQKKFHDIKLNKGEQWPSILSGNEYIPAVSGENTPKRSWSDGLQRTIMPATPEAMSGS